MQTRLLGWTGASGPAGPSRASHAEPGSCTPRSTFRARREGGTVPCALAAPASVADVPRAAQAGQAYAFRLEQPAAPLQRRVASLAALPISLPVDTSGSGTAGALKPLPRDVENVADDPSLHNPLARMQRLGTGWMGVRHTRRARPNLRSAKGALTPRQAGRARRASGLTPARSHAGNLRVRGRRAGGHERPALQGLAATSGRGGQGAAAAVGAAARRGHEGRTGARRARSACTAGAACLRLRARVCSLAALIARPPLKCCGALTACARVWRAGRAGGVLLVAQPGRGAAPGRAQGRALPRAAGRARPARRARRQAAAGDADQARGAAPLPGPVCCQPAGAPGRASRGGYAC